MLFADDGMVKMNFPEESVVVPIVAPCKETEAPFTGRLFWSTTDPFIILFWAAACFVKHKNKRMTNSNCVRK